MTGVWQWASVQVEQFFWGAFNIRCSPPSADLSGLKKGGPPKNCRKHFWTLPSQFFRIFTKYDKSLFLSHWLEIVHFEQQQSCNWKVSYNVLPCYHCNVFSQSVAMKTEMMVVLWFVLWLVAVCTWKYNKARTDILTLAMYTCSCALLLLCSPL